MTMSKSMHPTVRKKIVIKLGGSTLEGLNKAFFSNFKKLQEEGYDIVVIHGGGPAINRELAKQNVASTVLNGVRVTSLEAMDIVQQTLIGKVNPFLVSQLNAAGILAVGLNGFDAQLLQSDFLDQDCYGYVGKISHVNSNLLSSLCEKGIVPVISCIGATIDGKGLNINGDTVASEVALAIGAESLLLVTDVSGIRIEGVYQKEVTPTLIDDWIENGQIYGGMIPKVQGALQVLNAGIPSVQIVNDQLNGTKIVSSDSVNLSLN